MNLYPSYPPLALTYVHQMTRLLPNLVEISTTSPPRSSAENRPQQPHTVGNPLLLSFTYSTYMCLADNLLFVRIGEDLRNVTSLPPNQKNRPSGHTWCVTLYPFLTSLTLTYI